jgi:Flp pilus assembly protein TadG
MRIVARLRHRGRSADGQTLVEFAITLPIIILLMLALFDLGRGVFTYNTLSQSARQASRLAIVDQNTTRVKDQAIAYAATLGLTSSNVDVCFKTYNSTQTSCSSPATDNCPQATRDIGCLAIVRTHLNYTPMTPFISTIWSSISLSSTSIVPIEYVCPSGTQTTCP